MNREEFKRGWISGRPETPCGAGSTVAATLKQRKVLAGWIKKYKIESVVDVGAGDLNWVRLMKLDIDYRPLDLVPRAPEVKQFDLVHEIPPACDMVWCLWLLNHLAEYRAKAALDNLLQTDCRFIIYTWRPALSELLDICPTEYVVINAEKQAELRLVKIWRGALMC